VGKCSKEEFNGRKGDQRGIRGRRRSEEEGDDGFAVAGVLFAAVFSVKLFFVKPVLLKCPF
jgi:hypothetical protein